MWFKQLSLFRLNPDALPDLAKLESGMEQHCFAPPSGLEWSSQGFVAPAGHAPDRLLHPLAGGALAALKREEKVLPAATIRDALDAKIADIEARECRPVGRKEKRELKEQITDDLRRGFSECFRVLDPGGVLVFKWNETQVKVREILELVPQQPIFGQVSGRGHMTHWMVFMKNGA